MITHKGKEVTIDQLDDLDEQDYTRIKTPRDLRVSDSIIHRMRESVERQQIIADIETRRLEGYKLQLKAAIKLQNENGKR